MKAYQINGQSLEQLKMVDLPRPVPGPGEVLIRQHAVSLNYLDLMIASGEFGQGPYPLIPGADSAGAIVALGAGVSGWQPGDAVLPGMMSHWHSGPLFPAAHQALRGVNQPGGLAEYAVVPAASLVAKPAHLSWNEASTLPVAATTAWNAMLAGDVRPGKTVLLLGTGGVSLMALQLAKACGARVIITSSSDEKLALARRYGADETINYRQHAAWDQQVQVLTGGQGADLIIESVGGATFARSLNAAAFNGTIFVIGLLGGTTLTLPVLPIMNKALRIIGNNTGSTESLRGAAEAIARHQIHPAIDKTFRFDDAPAAYRYLHSAQHSGKVVIDIGEVSS